MKAAPKRWRRYLGRYYYEDNKGSYGYAFKSFRGEWLATAKRRDSTHRTLREAKAWVERTIAPRRRKR